MSELLKRYEESTRLRPSQARQIPELTTNFFDLIDQWAKGFTTFEKKGNPTLFTSKALDHYLTERKEMVIPDNFVPTEQGIDLSRWSRDKKYYTMGQPNE